MLAVAMLITVQEVALTVHRRPGAFPCEEETSVHWGVFKPSHELFSGYRGQDRGPVPGAL